MIKKTLTLFLSISLASLVHAQKIKLKKDKVLVDKKEFLEFERGGSFGALTYEISELSSGKRLVLFTEYNNGTHMDITDDYTKIKFLSTGESAEINGGSIKDAIKLLLKNQVLTKDGTIDEVKIDLFIKNYDENISGKTIRVRG